MTEEFGSCSGPIQGQDLGIPKLATPMRSLASTLAATIAKILYWPLDRQQIIITQRFGSAHKGLDIGIGNGTKLYSPFPVRAQIVKLGWDTTGYGIMIGLKNDEYGLYVILGHLQKINPDLRVGQWVEPGDFLGWSDSTGNSTGPHLHLEVRESPNGYYPYPSSCIDPERLLQWRVQAPPPPTPPPTTGNRWKTRKPISIYVVPSVGGQVVGHLPQGQVFTATVANELDPLRDWLKLGNNQYVMSRNKGKVLVDRV